MKDDELDKMLRQILVDTLEQGRQEEGPEFVPSLRHQRQMQAMLRNPLAWAKRREQPLWKKIFRQVAVILLLFSLGFGSILALSPTVRANVFQWVTAWSEKHVGFHYGTDQPKGGYVLPRYVISALPENYIEDEEYHSEYSTSFSTLYRDSENERDCVSFDYFYMHDETLLQIDLSDSDAVFPAAVHGLAAWAFLPEDKTVYSGITWIDPKSNIQFSLDKSGASLEELQELAESVVLME